MKPGESVQLGVLRITEEEPDVLQSLFDCARAFTVRADGEPTTWWVGLHVDGTLRCHCRTGWCLHVTALQDLLVRERVAVASATAVSQADGGGA